jgi:hypothetical protein
MIAATTLLIALLVVGGVFSLAAIRASLWTPDCSGGRLFTRPLSPEHVALTARIVRTAHTNKIAGSWAGSWAIGIVEERFWGLPWWARTTLLTNSMFWEGRTYFISGTRAYGLLAHHLPIVDATACGNLFAVPVADAAPELRLLHERAPDGQSRTLGFVLAANHSIWKPKPPGAPERRRTFRSWRNHESRDLYEWGLNSPRTHRPLGGARIGVTGPSGTFVLIADRDGVYELSSLPAGDYTLHLLDVPAYQFSKDQTVRVEAIPATRPSRMDLVANWMGSIAVTVTDRDGHPVGALVELRNPDGTRTDPAIGSYRMVVNGSFRFENLPDGGRYLVLMNRFGPSVSSPYLSLYYPNARRPEDARILEIHGPEPIRTVDFLVTRLPERKVRVRATWPDGRPVGGGSVSVTNAQAEAYDDLGASADDFTTGDDGLAEVVAFGDGPVKIQASAFNPEEVEPPFCSYSGAVLLEGPRLPLSMDLVVPFAPGHRSR